MTPEFTSSQTSGCAPLVVSFKDLTTGNPRFWNWDFGNGTLANVQNPSVSFPNPGTYTVKLVVRNADGTTGITKTNYITVYPAPTASFLANITTGCVPVNIQFNDASTSPSGSIVSWEWDFGDGGKSTAQNPQHTYTNTGFYTVTLTVTSSTGCKNILSVGRYIRIVSGVKAEFEPGKSLTCQPPYNITYINNSSGPGNMTFQWDLGNGNSSTLSAPSTTYPAGTYNVSLTATSEFGCSNTITKPITFSGPTTLIKAPDTVCLNTQVTFVNDGSVAPQKTLWDFGNGQQSTSINGTTVYTSSGDYTIKVSNTYSGCKDEAVKKIYVRPGTTIDFTATNATACKPPLNVTFKDASPVPNTKWEWDFGDGTIGTGAPVNHSYNAAGIFDVTATFTDAAGCIGKVTKPAVVKIEAPTVKINTVRAGGCVPYTYQPTATATSIDGITGWLWDFGDGTTSTLENPTHVYNNTGKYNIKLTVTTTGGCTATTTEIDGVKVGTPPATNFSIGATDVCASSPVNFTDLTPKPVDEWEWDFGDGGSSNIQNPSHLFLDTGTFIVKLTAFNNRCPQTSTGQTVIIRPPIANFKYAITCGNPTVAFRDTSIVDPAFGPVSYSWSFGSPSNTSNLQNPSFTFPAFNTIYPVTLTVTNGSCSSTFTDNINLVKPIADFTVPSANLCQNTDYNITSTNNQYITSHQWSFDGGPWLLADKVYTVKFSTLGQHSIGLVITDINGCTDTVRKANIVTVVGPTAKFTAGSSGGCKNALVTFNDNSTSSGVSPINKWTFDFGNGNTQSYTAAPFSHAYPDTGTFVPMLTVQDAMGCVNTYTLPDTIFISTLKTDFTSDYDTICPTSNLQFANESVGRNLTYQWYFGDGGTSTDKDPIYSYSVNNAKYDVKLVVTDRGGCKDSVTKAGFITTLKPIPAFDIEDTLTICPPIETKFTFNGSFYESFEWDFDDGATSTLKNPTHFYNAYGDFKPKLILTGYGGCTESVSATVHVYNPGTVTTLNYSPLDACNELMVDFNLVTIPDMKYTLYFGDGVSDTTMQNTYQHFYKSPAFYFPQIQYTDKQGCIAGVDGPPIKVIGAEPFFGLDRKKFCDSGTVYFTNYTIGNDPVVTRNWDFGDGSTSTDVDPSHNYSQPGLYKVSQSVTTQQGCSKTVTDTIKVYRTPDPYITGDSIGCLNATLNLLANLVVPDTAITWKWTLGNRNFSSPDIALNFVASGNYTVNLQATNLLGCSDTTSKALFVPEIPQLTVVEDPIIPVTTGITLPVTYGPEVISYHWTPAKNLSCTDCPTPYANPKLTTTYNVKVADQYGCTNTANVTVTTICNGLNYFIPNTFSPNGDGVNDIFAPRGVGLTRVNSMRIFNRWGEMVFEKMNFMANDRTPSGGWDGNYKGKPASADVYVYIVEFVCENAAIVPVKGNVALVR
ncbi:PKD domain-containing protein [Niastella sp. OAS944]|uniref:PKD domain-containing protein n=1 Tax=Niastella sp. OAS944 TaxID=2664089 RepID=UPI00348F3877|nr:gliding motility-associated-like protein [Chitinophagaceae bacterium OAS944]